MGISADTALIENLAQLTPRDHSCLICRTREEQLAVAVPFVRLGLERGEKCLCITTHSTKNAILEALPAGGIDVNAAVNSGALMLSTTREAYLERGCFAPERLIHFLSDAVDTAKVEGFAILRVAVEMSRLLDGNPGNDQIMGWERRLDSFLLENDVLTLCLYNRAALSPGIILDAIHAHPLVISGGVLSHNPSYIPPESSLGSARTEQEVERLLADIGALQREESALRNNEEHFGLLSERIPLGYQSLDEKGRFLEVNQAWFDALGYSREEVIGRWFGDFVVPEYRELCKKGFERFKSAGEMHGMRLAVLHRDGSRIELVIDGKIGYDRHGEFKQTHCIVRNITKHKEAERRLKSQRHILQMLADFDEIISRLGVAGAVNHALDFIEERMAMPHVAMALWDAERCGFRLFDVRMPVAGLEKGSFFPFESTILSKVVEEEKVIYRPDLRAGKTLYEADARLLEAGIRCECLAPLIAENKCVGTLNIATTEVDGISKEKRLLLALMAPRLASALDNATAFEALSASEERFRQMAENMGEVFWLENPQCSVIHYVSPAYERIWGRSCASVYEHPRSWMDAIVPQDRARIAEVLEKRARGAYPQGYRKQYRLTRPDGSLRWIQDRVYPIHDKDGQISQFVGISQDITERMLAQERLEQERRLFMGGPVVVFRWIAAEGWPVEYVSPNVETLFGYQADDFTEGRMRYADVVHPDDRQRVADEVAKHSERGVASFEQDYRIIRPDGQVRWLFDFTLVARNEEGVITHYEGYVLDVSEHKRAEETLRQTTVTLNNILSSASEYAIAATDLDLRVIHFNPAAEQMFGYSADQIIGQTVQEIHAGRGVGSEKVERAIQVVMRDGKWEADLRVQGSDGRERTVHPVVMPMRDEEGKCCGYVFFARDITGRKRAEEQLSIRNHAIESSAISFAVADLQGRLTYANSSFLEAWGYDKPQEVVGRPVIELWQTPPNTERFVPTLLEQGHWQGELSGKRKDGTVFDVYVSASMVKDDQSRPVCLAASFLDVTWRKKVEKALSQRDAVLKAVGFAAERFLKQTDWKQSISEVLEQMGHASGVSRASVFEYHISPEGEALASLRYEWAAPDTTPQIDDPRMQNIHLRKEGFGLWLDVLAQGRIVAGHLRDFSEKQRRLFEGQGIKSLMLVPIFVSEKLWGWGGFTECRVERKWSEVEIDSLQAAANALGAAIQRKQVEEELARHRENLEELVEQRTNELEESRVQLRRSERLASIGTLAAGIAHEINNPVGVILLSAQNAVRRLNKPEHEAAIHRALDNIIEDARRCGHIVRSVLQFARSEKTDKWPNDLGRLIGRAADLTRGYAEKNQAVLKTHYPNNLPEVVVNPVQLTQVLVNLIQNAIEAGEAGIRVEVGAVATVRGVRVTVQDNGRGLSDEQKEHLFDPFYTTRRSSGGTGLGLSIVHGIITEHGGSLDLQGQLGYGTTISFELPAVGDMKGVEYHA
ncbi:MAG: PAS domain S-box protein [Phycisphaerae bacterium]|nr:PAS domain S-box protein [Phycisphaerae bacterium]